VPMSLSYTTPFIGLWQGLFGGANLAASSSSARCSSLRDASASAALSATPSPAAVAALGRCASTGSLACTRATPFPFTRLHSRVVKEPKFVTIQNRPQSSTIGARRDQQLVLSFHANPRVHTTLTLTAPECTWGARDTCAGNRTRSKPNPPRSPTAYTPHLPNPSTPQLPEMVRGCIRCRSVRDDIVDSKASERKRERKRRRDVRANRFIFYEGVSCQIRDLILGEVRRKGSRPG
jgi:hypothetical protein